MWIVITIALGTVVPPGIAAQEVPLGEVPPPPEDTFEYDHPDAPVRAPRSAGADVGRIAGEVLGGVIGGFGAIPIGLLIALVGIEEGCDDFCALGTLALGTFAAAGLTIPAGVYLAGNAAGGAGGFGWTFLAGAFGAGLGIGGAAIADDGLTDAAVGLTAVAMIAGSMLGYELSSEPSTTRRPRRRRRRRAALRTSVVPTVGATADGHGMSVGLMGTL